MIRFKHIRAGGRVKRFHACDIIGQQTVAEHSWGVIMILFEIHPSTPSRDLLFAAAVHDVPERFTGDIPAPIKWNRPKLKQAIDEAEKDIEDTLGIGVKLNHIDGMLLKIADGLDLAWTCVEQKRLGNRGIKETYDNIMSSLIKVIAVERGRPMHPEYTKAYNMLKSVSLDWDNA